MATQEDLLMLDLVNAERAAVGLPGLVLDVNLDRSAEGHSDWMLDTDTFSHTGRGASTPTERIEWAGYDLDGTWATGENIAWQSERGEEGIEDDIRDLHDALMNSPSHRAAILSPDYEEVGFGIQTGGFDGYDAIMVTQHFASSDGEARLDTAPAPEVAEATPLVTMEPESTPAEPEPSTAERPLIDEPPAENLEPVRSEEPSDDTVTYDDLVDYLNELLNALYGVDDRSVAAKESTSDAVNSAEPCLWEARDWLEDMFG